MPIAAEAAKPAIEALTTHSVIRENPTPTATKTRLRNGTKSAVRLSSNKSGTNHPKPENRAAEKCKTRRGQAEQQAAGNARINPSFV